jgi:ribosomal protein S27AE
VTDTSPDGDRAFTFLANAYVLVTVKAPTVQAARTAYEEINTEEFAVDFTTGAGHHLDELSVEDTAPELYRVDGEELGETGETCPRPDCGGYLINDRCTDAECPSPRR